MKIDWTIQIADVLIIITLIVLGYFAIKYDVASHNEAIRKCEMWYSQAFNTTSGFKYPFNFTINNTTTEIYPNK